MKQNRYDIFISYRRTAYDTANLVAEKLRNAGYRVFFDVDTLTSGKFNEQLLEVIRHCTDFIIVLPKDGLDRCNDPEDWIRREVACAIDSGKNIVPIMLTGFEWPRELPSDIADLPNYQAVTPTGHAYFDMAVERLKGYLKSKPSIPIKNWMTKAAIVMAVLLAFVGVGYGVCVHIANVTCEEIATKQAKIMGTVDLLCDVCQDLAENSDKFLSTMEKVKDEEEKKDLEDEMLSTLKRLEKDVDKYKSTFPVPEFTISSTGKYVLAYYGIQQEELDAFGIYYGSLYDDMDEVFVQMREIIENDAYSVNTKELVDLHVHGFKYFVNAYYYAYLGCLSLFPKSARKTHHEFAKKWKNFPNGVPLDLPQEEYEQFQEKELYLYQEEMSRYEAHVNFEDRKLNEMEDQLDQLEQKVNEAN